MEGNWAMTNRKRLTGVWREENPENLSLPRLSSACTFRPMAPEKVVVLEYLKSGESITAEPGQERCLLCKDAYSGSGSLLADGEWAWPETLIHYADVHNIEPEQDFLEKILRQSRAT